jgi:hypothetical protein
MTAIFQRGNLLVLILAVCATSWTADKPTTATSADRIVIVKSERTLTLMSGGKVLKTYKVALGGDPVGPKVKAGDKKTPEGEYVIDSKNAKSRFHLALHISYPNTADRERASQAGSESGRQCRDTRPRIGQGKPGDRRDVPQFSKRRAAQPFDFADIIDTESAPFLRVLCEGAGTTNPHTAKLRCPRVGPPFVF